VADHGREQHPPGVVGMTQGPQASGDYGYDLAHEEPGGGKTAAPRPEPERTGPAPAHSSVDPDEDFGYDEAHDF
jgi:hypothetical protein